MKTVACMIKTETSTFMKIFVFCRIPLELRDHPKVWFHFLENEISIAHGRTKVFGVAGVAMGWNGKILRPSCLLNIYKEMLQNMLLSNTYAFKSIFDRE